MLNARKSSLTAIRNIKAILLTKLFLSRDASFSQVTELSIIQKLCKVVPALMLSNPADSSSSVCQAATMPQSQPSTDESEPGQEHICAQCVRTRRERSSVSSGPNFLQNLCRVTSAFLVAISRKHPEDSGRTRTYCRHNTNAIARHAHLDIPMVPIVRECRQKPWDTAVAYPTQLPASS
jgi:hypothetical protein